MIFSITTLLSATNESVYTGSRKLFIEGKDAKDGNTIIWGLRTVPAKFTEKYLKGFTILSVNKGDIQPSGYRGSLLVKNGDPTKYFNNMPEFATLLSTKTKPITTLKEAEEIAKIIPAAFSYEIIETPPKKLTWPKLVHKKAVKFTPKKRENWVSKITTTKMGWSFEFTVLTDDYIMHYCRVKITVAKTGKVGASDLTVIHSGLGYN